MGTFCHLQNVVLLLWYKDTFIDSYCLLQNDYTYFHLCLLWVESVLYINCQSTWSVLILHTLQYPYGYRQGYGYGVWIYMDTPQSIISIWIQTWIRIMDLHGVWRHLTFHNIHMDTDIAPCLHLINVTYFRYQNRYHIISHNSRILNIKSLNFEIYVF